MKKLNEQRRDLLLGGAFHRISEVVNTLNLTEWKQDPTEKRTVLNQVASPYLPSDFFDEFGEEEPTKNELLCANIKNFIANIDLIMEDIAKMSLPNLYQKYILNEFEGIKTLLGDELKELEIEIKYDDYDQDVLLSEDLINLRRRKDDLEWFPITKEEYEDLPLNTWVIDVRDDEYYVLGYCADNPIEYSEDFFNFGERHEVSKMMLKSANISIEEAIEIANQNEKIEMEHVNFER